VPKLDPLPNPPVPVSEQAARKRIPVKINQRAHRLITFAPRFFMCLAYPENI